MKNGGGVEFCHDNCPLSYARGDNYSNKLKTCENHELEKRNSDYQENITIDN